MHRWPLICILLYGLGQLLYPDPVDQRVQYSVNGEQLFEPNGLLENLNDSEIPLPRLRYNCFETV